MRGRRAPTARCGCYPGASACGDAPADAGDPTSEARTGVIRGSCAARPARPHPGAAGLALALLLGARRRRAGARDRR
ncbi:MAG: hypothetical protein U0325_14890 [Polyangiales bacterium]